MSRHRNVRNLDVDDILDEQDGYDEEEPMTEEQKEQLEMGVAQVKSLIEGVDVPQNEIEETLWYYYFDISQTVEYLLSKYSKPKIKNDDEGDQDKKAPKSGLLALANQRKQAISTSGTKLKGLASLATNRQGLSSLIGKEKSRVSSIHHTNTGKLESQTSNIVGLEKPARNLFALALRRKKAAIEDSQISKSIIPIDDVPPMKPDIVSKNDKHLVTPIVSTSNENVIVTPIVSTSSENVIELQDTKILPSSLKQNLIASPSIFASFIFKSFLQPKLYTNISFSTADKSSSTFKFDEPSPDDVILAAQKGVKTKKTNVKPERQNVTANNVRENSSNTTKSSTMAFDISAMNLNDGKLISTNESSQKSTPITSAASSRPVTPKPIKNRIDVVNEYEKRESGKPSLNMVIIGHVDAGKSTLMGHLLVLLGAVSEKTFQKYERESKKIGKGSFAFAWVLDETEEERSRGVTIDIAMNSFETSNRKFTILDAPGHRDFIPNMISGAAQADVAILVVDATTGEFESGFQGNGQTKEHALLVRSLGVQQIIIAINKLDMMDWSKVRFDEIQGEMITFLLQAGFKKNNLTFIPCSGLTGENLVKKSNLDKLKWYNGPSIVDQIDNFDPPQRQVEKPLRMSVADVFKGGIGSSSGVTVSGRVESGSLQVGESLLVIPGNEIGIVKALEVGDESAKWAVSGDNVLVTLSSLELGQVPRGAILCAPEYPIPIASAFLTQVIIFDIKVPITTGFPIILHHRSVNEPAYVRRLISTIDKSTGEIVKKNPRALTKGQTATMEIALNQRPIPLETFKNNKDLGRIMIRKGGETIGAGIILELL